MGHSLRGGPGGKSRTLMMMSSKPRNWCADLRDGDGYCFIGLVRGLPIYLKIHKSKHQRECGESSSFDASVG